MTDQTQAPAVTVVKAELVSTGDLCPTCPLRDDKSKLVKFVSMVFNPTTAIGHKVQGFVAAVMIIFIANGGALPKPIIQAVKQIAAIYFTGVPANVLTTPDMTTTSPP